MVKFFGLEPKSKTKKLAQEFEDKVRIRIDNQQLISKVYTYLSENNWALAFAYNQVVNPGIFGSENRLEVKYTYVNKNEPKVMRIDTQSGEDRIVTSESFETPDAFVVWALNKERELMMNPT